MKLTKFKTAGYILLATILLRVAFLFFNDDFSKDSTPLIADKIGAGIIVLFIACVCFKHFFRRFFSKT